MGVRLLTKERQRLRILGESPLLLLRVQLATLIMYRV
jgi:hypothetical protein